MILVDGWVVERQLLGATMGYVSIRGMWGKLLPCQPRLICRMRSRGWLSSLGETFVGGNIGMEHVHVHILYFTYINTWLLGQDCRSR